MNQNVIYEILHNKMETAPNSMAIFDEERTITRMELERLINTIAVKIPTEAHRVGIMMEHTVEMIAAVFAVLKTGKAYVPVEPFFQQERTEFMMKDAGVDMILTNSGHREKAEGGAVRNRNVCHYVRAFQNEFHPDEADTMLQYSVCPF